jgi:hypothetical protein
MRITFAPALGMALAAALLAGCAVKPVRQPPRPAGAAPVPAAPIASPPLRLRLIGETRLANRVGFQGTTVGGLSAIDYDAESGTWYLLSDDRSEHGGSVRFYTARIDYTASAFERVELTSTIPIRRPDGSLYPKGPAFDTPDPESLRFDPLTKSLLWTSEGERRPPRILQPSVRKMSLDGKYQDQLALPPIFTIVSEREGPRNNLGFEAMALSPSARHIWIANEDALFQDGPVSSLKKGGTVRLTQFDRTARKAVAQYAYPLDPIPHPPNPVNDYADNGVAEILALTDSRFLFLERSFAVGVGNTIRLFEASIENASNVLDQQSLHGNGFRPMSKRLVLDFASLGLPRIDNIKGMSWGPKLPNGNRSLVFVSDDNFNPDQVTQFIAVEVAE